jgi:hypothetical protein
MRHVRLLTTCFAVCATLAACEPKHGSTPPAEPRANAPAAGGAATVEDACPVQVPATTVTVVNAKGAVVMYFTTTKANLEELRRRVSLLARLGTPPAGAEARPAATPTPGPPWVYGAQPELVPLHATAQEVSDGAALTLTPLDPDDLEQLRAYARNHAERMRLGRCAADFMKWDTGSQKADAAPADNLG